MFQSAGLTTNNHTEAYNSRLGKSVKLGKHPNFYLWTDSIISELKNSSVEAAMAISGNPNVRPMTTKARKSQQRREKLMIELSQGSIHLQAVGGSLAKIQQVTEEIDEDLDPIILQNNPVEVAVPALEDITVPAEYRPTLAVLPSKPDQMSSSNVSTFIPQTPAITDEQSYRRVQGLKRRSDISHSVLGANLRKKR